MEKLGNQKPPGRLPKRWCKNWTSTAHMILKKKKKILVKIEDFKVHHWQQPAE